MESKLRKVFQFLFIPGTHIVLYTLQQEKKNVPNLWQKGGLNNNENIRQQQCSDNNAPTTTQKNLLHKQRQ
jgi:hypothetical protein